MGLPVERDLHFWAEKRLSSYARDARLAGRIAETNEAGHEGARKGSG